MVEALPFFVFIIVIYLQLNIVSVNCFFRVFQPLSFILFFGPIMYLQGHRHLTFDPWFWRYK